MMVTIVAAVAENRVIGKDNDLPWHMPADMKHFRNVTMGKPVIMGRVSLEALGGKPLKGRTNIILTRDENYEAEGCIVVHSIEESLKVAAGIGDEVMMLGGGDLYEQFLPRTDRMILTEIHHEFEGDTRFPEFDKGEWVEVERRDFEADEKNPYPYSFVTWERKK